jgi:hypothetical protein
LLPNGPRGDVYANIMNVGKFLQRCEGETWLLFANG